MPKGYEGDPYFAATDRHPSQAAHPHRTLCKRSTLGRFLVSFWSVLVQHDIKRRKTDSKLTLSRISIGRLSLRRGRFSHAVLSTTQKDVRSPSRKERFRKCLGSGACVGLVQWTGPGTLSLFRRSLELNCPPKAFMWIEWGAPKNFDEFRDQTYSGSGKCFCASSSRELCHEKTCPQKWDKYCRTIGKWPQNPIFRAVLPRAARARVYARTAKNMHS